MLNQEIVSKSSSLEFLENSYRRPFRPARTAKVFEAATQSEVDDAVAAFLAKGGKVTTLPVKEVTSLDLAHQNLMSKLLDNRVSLNVEKV